MAPDAAARLSRVTPSNSPVTRSPRSRAIPVARGDPRAPPFSPRGSEAERRGRLEPGWRDTQFLHERVDVGSKARSGEPHRREEHNDRNPAHRVGHAGFLLLTSGRLFAAVSAAGALTSIATRLRISSDRSSKISWS